MKNQLFVLVSVLCSVNVVFSGELTFELPDNENMCFHEHVDKGEQATFEFQVITGGNYDVDLEIKAPNNQVLYKDIKKQYDSFSWTADYKGVHSFCFSNEFSTFTHKIVYFDLQVWSYFDINIVMLAGFLFPEQTLENWYIVIAF